MLVVRAPLRVSFFGGGTDQPEYYEHYGPGRVLSAAITPSVYVVIQKRWDNLICAHGVERELVATVDEIKHDLIRECLRLRQLGPGLEVTTLADVPGTGTGLGSSSSLLVALLHALGTWKHSRPVPEWLARTAYLIEREVLGRPVGKQDQYAAAYGGVNLLTFTATDTEVQALRLGGDRELALSDRLMLFYTGVTRQAAPMLADWVAHTSPNADTLAEMAKMANVGERLLRAGDLDGFGGLLDEGWTLKRGLCRGITNPSIDRMYALARDAGALGGKITGAGGGGFLLVYVPPERQDDVRRALAEYRELPFRLEPEGARVILQYQQYGEVS